MLRIQAGCLPCPISGITPDLLPLTVLALQRFEEREALRCRDLTKTPSLWWILTLWDCSYNLLSSNLVLGYAGEVIALVYIPWSCLIHEEFGRRESVPAHLRLRCGLFTYAHKELMSMLLCSFKKRQVKISQCCSLVLLFLEVVHDPYS